MAKKVDRKAIEQDVLRLLRNNGKTAFRPKEMAKRLNYQETAVYKAFRETLSEMEASGAIHRLKGGRYTFRSQSMHDEGVLHIHPEGYGFVEIEDQEQDLFVAANKTGTALDGDRVRVALLAPVKGDRRQEAEVVEVVERRRKQTVGTFKVTRHLGFVVSDDLRINHDIFVPDKHFNGANDGDKVVVSIDRFVDRKAAPEGRILHVIGPAHDPDVKIIALAMSQDVRVDFPEEVLKETETISERIPASEIERRLDLRQKQIFTIDPVDAKDFDDAIHIEQTPDGSFEVGVHIADVSHYVSKGTSLDEEALKRATSVYLVDRVIPMLPEKLSNLVCSLRPDEEKLTYSCILTLSPEGRVQDYTIRESVIRSEARLSYEGAQAIIDGHDRAHPLKDEILLADRLARKLRKDRFESGSVNFVTPEVKIHLDEAGNPVEIVKKKLQAANHLIEEFMLLANKTVAQHIGKGDPPRPFVYRIHDRPNAEKIQILADYVRAFGYKLPLKGGNVRAVDLNDFLKQVEGTPEEAVIEEAALRAMAKAIYSTDNIGHYGLGFRYYSHFTSPIRRYPDLIVHRLLKAYAEGKSGADSQTLMNECEHCSERERAAAEAERESVKLKQVEYLGRHIGDKFSGVVSGVTRFGVFVELDDILIEGLVHVRDMNDYFEYDEKNYSLVGQYSGRRIRLGDSVKVCVVRTDLQTRKIDFVFADTEAG